MNFYVAYEDALSLDLIQTVFSQMGKGLCIHTQYHKGGSGFLKKNVVAFNNLARKIPFLLLTDLDDAECAPALIQSWLGQEASPHLLFRVAVREVESWVMADRTKFASFMGVSVNSVSINPDQLIDPKRALLDLAIESRKAFIREDLLPVGSAQKGPGYNNLLGSFLKKHWRMTEAQKHSPSLKKMIHRLNEYVDQHGR